MFCLFYLCIFVLQNKTKLVLSSLLIFSRNIRSHKKWILIGILGASSKRNYDMEKIKWRLIFEFYSLYWLYLIRYTFHLKGNVIVIGKLYINWNKSNFEFQQYVDIISLKRFWHFTYSLNLWTAIAWFFLLLMHQLVIILFKDCLHELPSLKSFWLKGWSILKNKMHLCD